MNKASKHVQSGVGIGGLLNSSQNSQTAGTQKNVINSIMSFLPDNRPITSLQIVEDFQSCPKNFTPIHRTYDQDADADLWRENNILFGRQTTRYLCLSKSEGLPDYVVETLKIIAEKIPSPAGFSLLSRTADTEQKAWRKRQIAYKLSKRGTVTHAVTDIILCSKLKIAPNGFKLAGEINGVLICYKTGAIPIRLPPPVPGLSLLASNGHAVVGNNNNNTNNNNNNSNCNNSSRNNISEVEKALNRLNLSGKGPLPPVPLPLDGDDDYEEIQASYQINSPQRPAPTRPTTSAEAKTTTTASDHTYTSSGHNIGTLGNYTELDGVPFVLNAALKTEQVVELPVLPQISELLKICDYDFQLERQTLCTMKSSASKNPFFK